MPLSNWLILDIATAPLPSTDLDRYVDVDDITAPSNWRDQAKIDAYIEEKRNQRRAAAGLDLDLCRLSAVGLWPVEAPAPTVGLCRTEDAERALIAQVADAVQGRTVVTYNGNSFDLPALQRRARWLGVAFPAIVTDPPWKATETVDLLVELAGRDPSRRRPLSFYAKRLGLDLVKPLSGEEEGRVFETQRWDDLEASVLHDLRATHALAQWWGVIA